MKKKHATVKSMRQKFRLTQEQFASLLDVSFATINRWEGARNGPGGWHEAILELLSMSLEKRPMQLVLSQLKTSDGQVQKLLRLATMASDNTPSRQKRK